MINKLYVVKYDKFCKQLTRRYFKIYKLFKWIIYKKEISFDEYLFKGDKYVD